MKKQNYGEKHVRIGENAFAIVRKDTDNIISVSIGINDDLTLAICRNREEAEARLNVTDFARDSFEIVEVTLKPVL